jgi:hypothetical protein
MSFDAAGRVVVGGGHFVDRGGQMVQEFANHVQVGSRAIGKLDEIKGSIESCFDWTSKYTHDNCQPFPEYKEVQVMPSLLEHVQVGQGHFNIQPIKFATYDWGPKAQPGVTTR